MKTVLLAFVLASAIPARIEAQRYDYHLLLDSTAPAAGAVLVSTGHRAEPALQRPDGLMQRSFVTVLPDSSGDTTTAELRVLIVSQGDRITRIVLRAAVQGADSGSVKTAARFFVQRLTAAFGRPMAADDDTDWCWSTRSRFIDLTLDRAYGEVSLTLGYGRQDR